VKKLLTTILLISTLVLSHAAETTVLAVVGNAETKISENSEWSTLATGDIIPVGSTIKTHEDSTVFLNPLVGVTSTVLENSELVISNVESATGSQSAMLDLIRGSLENDLDVKEMKTDFQVRTPQGVASARGTIFLTMDNGVIVVREGTVMSGNTAVGVGQVFYRDASSNVPILVNKLTDLPQNVQTQIANSISNSLSAQLTAIRRLPDNSPAKAILVKSLARSILTAESVSDVVDPVMVASIRESLVAVVGDDVILQGVVNEAHEEYLEVIPFDEVSPSQLN
jgi:hypothetical protein